VDDLLCDPNLAPVREAGRRIAMASRLLRWNFERLLALNEAVKEENAKLKEEVRELKAAVAAAEGRAEDAGMVSEDTASTDGADTPAASTADVSLFS